MNLKPEAVRRRAVSCYLRVRGVRLHVRVLGPEGVPCAFVLHGWLDTSASFLPFAEVLRERAGGKLRVVIPDQRGFGYSQSAPQGYWFPDYVADLAAIAAHFGSRAPFDLVGHSMGAQVVSLYAGLQPERVRRLVIMDGLGVADMPVERAPGRYSAWLEKLGDPPVNGEFLSFDALAARIRQHHPRLNAEQAHVLARSWGVRGASGRVRLLADALHRMDGPLLYRSAAAEAIWRQVTAPTLILLAGESPLRARIGAAELERRQACFVCHRVVTLDGIGHMMHVEAPRRSADAVAGHLLQAVAKCT